MSSHLNYFIMNNFAKVLVTIGVIVLFLALFGAIVGTREASGHSTPGFLGVILLLAVIGAVRAIWKSGKKDGDKSDSNSSVLQK